MTTDIPEPLGVAGRGRDTSPATVHAQRRSRTGWRSTSVRVAPLVGLGIVLGPHASGVLSPAALAVLDPAVLVALAVLGVLAGLALELRGATDRRLLAAGAAAGGTTGLVVAAGMALTALGMAGAAGGTTLTLAALAGIAAASSLALPTSGLDGDPSVAQRTMELGVILPVAGGGLLLALLREGSALGAASLTLQAGALVLIIAVAAWLLLDTCGSLPDSRVFGMAILLLLGGVTDYLAVSALLGGLLAGACWRRVGGGVRDGIERDVLRVRHPLVALVLLTAGARAEISMQILALGALYAVLRTAGTVAGARVAARTVPLARLPADLGVHLLPPGVFGIAFALNALRAAGNDLTGTASLIIVGTAIADLVSRAADTREDAA